MEVAVVVTASMVGVVRLTETTITVVVGVIFAVNDSGGSSSSCWLVVKRPSNVLVYLNDGSAQTILRAATLR